MTSCIDADCLVYYEKKDVDCEMETRVLIDWLNKGKYFYHAKTGEEVSIQGALVELLPKIKNKALKKEMEECLKKSVKAAS